MPNLYSLLCFGSIALAIFAAGFLLGYAIRTSYRYRLILNQNRGEASVRNLIVSNFGPPNFHLLNNITIPFQDGTTQIDHILISTKGVFVIETKHYSGWIFANEKSKKGLLDSTSKCNRLVFKEYLIRRSESKTFSWT